MSNNFKQIFFVLVRQKNIEDIQIKDIESFKSELKKVQKVDNCEIDPKNAEFYLIYFKYLTKYRPIFLK